MVLLHLKYIPNISQEDSCVGETKRNLSLVKNLMRKYKCNLRNTAEGKPISEEQIKYKRVPRKKFQKSYKQCISHMGHFNSTWDRLNIKISDFVSQVRK